MSTSHIHSCDQRYEAERTRQLLRSDHYSSQTEMPRARLNLRSKQSEHEAIFKLT